MEEILDQTGPWHYPVLLLNAIGGFPYPWRVMSLQFMAPKDLNYWCARPNDSISLDDWRVANDGVDLRCFVKKDDDITNGTAVRCNSWEYDHSYYTRTLTEDWDAVCDRRWLVDSSQSFFMSGMLSTLVFSHISDWYGRCTALRISLVLSLVTGFAAASASNFWAFSVLRMANNAVGVGFFTLAVESIGTSKRAMVSLSSEFGWFIGLIVYPVVVYYIRDWRVLQIVSAVPDVFLLLSTLFLDESPKWLVSMGRFDKAKTLLSKIVQRNKLRNVDIAAIVKAAREKIAAVGVVVVIGRMLVDAENKIRGSVFDLFRGFILARTTLACTLN
ncbi:solute carrier family 22 member 6-B-like [Tropilaelaps mercedesae]|uniref:Solute carrier family 22 member 6-B-like n=1 Tax=Tropilaelaps mercedesae TaxID=418985 RepID=A0A1V9X391_9ACAR|nr:solute carrier family 22 member 6-B-like [Tropilaelaps mercedesae]